MRALKVLVVLMGVLIVGGTLTLGVLIARRASSVAGPAGEAVLDEPAGTRIAGVSSANDHSVLWLQGGGPDRAVAVDLRTGKVLGRVRLAH